MAEQRVIIEDDCVQVENRRGKILETKHISFEKFGTIMQDKVPMDSGFLPVYPSAAIRRYKQSQNGKIYLVEFLAGKRKLRFEKNNGEVFDTFEMDLPTVLLFVLVPKTGRIDHYNNKCFFSQFPAATGKVPLYLFPLGNAYEDGKICLGTNEIKNLDSLCQDFWSMPFNFHLNHLIKRESTDRRTGQEIVTMYKEAGKIPMNLWKPYSKTVDAVFTDLDKATGGY